MEKPVCRKSAKMTSWGCKPKYCSSCSPTKDPNNGMSSSSLPSIPSNSTSILSMLCSKTADVSLKWKLCNYLCKGTKILRMHKTWVREQCIYYLCVSEKTAVSLWLIFKYKMRDITLVLNIAPGCYENLIHSKIKPAAKLSDLSLPCPSIQQAALDSADTQINGYLNHITTSINTTQSCKWFVLIWY